MFGVLKSYLSWLITSLLALGLILSNENMQVNTMRDNFSDLLVIVARPVSNLIRAPRLWGENARLRKQLAELSIKVADISDSAVETERLRHMLDFRERSAYELVATEVIGMNPDFGIRGILVDAGSEDGVEINQAVITPDGVVGRVYRAGKRSSAVQLLLDPNSGVAARLGRSREVGIVHAAGGRRLRLDGVPVTAAVGTGDSVITSGLGGVFPPGLLIGVTRSVNHRAVDWLWQIELQPAVDFGHLYELFVVRTAERAE